MSLKDITFKSGATYPQTGGSADPIADAGGDLNKKRLIFTTESLAAQRKIDFTVVNFKASATSPDGNTQGRRQVYFRYPFLTASGLYTMNTASIEINASIEATDGTISLFRQVLIQILNDSGADGFWNDLSVA
jgi:hypothetical protein